MIEKFIYWYFYLIVLDFNSISSHQMFSLLRTKETIESFTGYLAVCSLALSFAYLFLRCTLRLSWQSAALCCFCCCACLLVLLQLLLLPRAVVVRGTFSSLSLSLSHPAINLSPNVAQRMFFFLPIPLFYSCCCSCFSFVLLFLTRLHPFPQPAYTHSAAV